MLSPFRAVSVLGSLALCPWAIGQQLVLDARAATAAAEPRTLEWVRRRIHEGCVLQAHDLRQAIAVLEDARAVAAALDDRVEEAVALASLARAEAQVDGPVVARALLARADAVLPGAAPPRAVAMVEYGAAMVHWLFDEIPDSMARWRRAMDAAESARDDRMIGYCSLLALSMLASDEDVLPELDRIDGLFRQAGEESGRLEVAMLRANVLRRYGDDGVVDRVREVVARAQTLGNRAIAAYGTFVIAHLTSQVPGTSDAGAFARAVAIARELGDRETLGLALEGQAEFLLSTGQLAAAGAAIDEAVATFEGVGMRARAYSALGTAIRIASSAADAAAARAFAERMSALERDLSIGSTVADRARYWRAYSAMRRELRQSQSRYEHDVAALGSRLDHTTWGSIGIVFALGLFASALLYRGQRRLLRINARLEDEIAATARAQEESRALQDSLRQLERLDSIGVLAGGLAHDFNNLLLAVLGNAELALAEPDLPSRVRTVLLQIVGAGNRAKALCKDILAYARTGHSERRIGELRELVARLLPIARAGFGAGVEVELAPTGDGLAVSADLAQLEQVFLNILVNAGEAVGDHGHVHVTLSTAVLGGGGAAAEPLVGAKGGAGADGRGHWFGDFPAAPREYVAVAVRDDGHGMTAETVRRIFDPFFSTRFPGRGLGLAVAYGTVRRHDGLLCVHSEVGLGSRFVVYLPRVAAVAPAAPEPPLVLPRPPGKRDSHPRAGVRVLVVDDEPAVREVARRLLQIAGCEPVVVASGREAVEQFERDAGGIAFALIDFTMPDMNGAELAAALRARRADLPIVIMSGHDEVELEPWSTDVGFLPKPFGIAELRAAIADLPSPSPRN